MSFVMDGKPRVNRWAWASVALGTVSVIWVIVVFWSNTASQLALFWFVPSGLGIVLGLRGIGEANRTGRGADVSAFGFALSGPCLGFSLLLLWAAATIDTSS